MKIQILTLAMIPALFASSAFASSEGYKRASKYMKVSADGAEAPSPKNQKRRVASAKKKKSHKKKSKK